MKRYAVIGFVAISIGLTLLVLAIRPWQVRPGVTKANFDRIENGMTVANVEAIFGQSSLECSQTSVIWTAWYSRDGDTACVVFVRDVVADKTWKDSTETFAAKIQRRLKRPAR